MNTLNTIVTEYSSSSELADQLGALLAEKAKIVELEKGIKKELISRGDPIVEGDIFRVTVSHVETSRSDWKKIANKLEPSRQLITAYTKTSESDRVSVKSKLA